MGRIATNPIGGATAVTIDATKVAKAGDTMTGALILATSSPATALEAASRGYVDSVVVGIASAVKVLPVAAVATTNLDLNGAETVDGVSITAGMRVLAAGQTTTSQGGIYVAAAGAWSRDTDADTAAEVTKGQAVFVSSGGTNYANTLWVSTATVTTLGTDPCTWAQIQGTAAVATLTNAESSATSLTISTNFTRFSSTSNVTATLPSAASWAGRMLVIQKTGSAGVVTVNRAGSDTINGLTSWTIDQQYDTLFLFSFTGSTDWMVL